MVNVHMSQRSKRPELIPVSLTWSMPRSIAIPPWTGCQAIEGLPPTPAVCHRYPFINLGEERRSWVNFLVQWNNATGQVWTPDPMLCTCISEKPTREWVQALTKVNSTFRNAVRCFHFLFPTCHALNTWFLLSWVKLFRKELKATKNYFALSGIDCTLVCCKHFWKGVVSRFAFSFHVLVDR